MERGLRLLFVEDVAAEAELAVHHLKRAGNRPGAGIRRKL
jgi:hypothetical protein